MNKDIKEMLRAEIETTFNKLKDTNLDGKERKAVVDDLIKLYHLAIDDEKSELEARLKRAESKNSLERQKKELDLKQNELWIKRDQFNLDRDMRLLEMHNADKQLKEQKIDRYIKIGISIVEIILPLIFYARWMRRGFEFERTGTFTSTTFRGLFSHFRPTKK